MARSFPGTPVIDSGNPVSNHPYNFGLAGWWLGLPNNSGGGTIFDLQGRYPGTLTNGPTWRLTPARPGGIGQCLLYDGVNDLVQTTLPGASVGVPNGINLGQAFFSIGCWFRSTTASTSKVLWSWNNGGATAGLILVATGLTYAANSNSTGAYTFAWTPDQLWHHVVLVQFGQSDAPALYLDGVPLGTTTASGAVNPLASLNVVIGGRVQASNCWQGYLDDFRVTSRSVSASEAWGWYDQSRRGNPDLIRRYTPGVWNTNGTATSPPPPGGRLARPCSLDGLGGAGQQAFNPSLGV